jgi:uncharacterized protein YdhG (YjbR/CyaY superfamily)
MGVGNAMKSSSSRGTKRATHATAPSAAEGQIQKYLSALPAGTRAVLQEIRTLIRAAVPDAVEVFSYGIPGFRLDGQVLVWYAGWKEHYSLYPMTDAIRRAHADALKGYEMSKGTVRFPLDEPLPSRLITRLVRARAAEARDRAKAKAKPR